MALAKKYNYTIFLNNFLWLLFEKYWVKKQASLI